MSNALAKQQLIDKYGRTCFLMGEISKRNYLTYHHIKPKRNGGRSTIQNGALLCQFEHQLFNTLERINKYKAEDINCGFQEYKITFCKILLIQLRHFVDYELQRQGYKVEEKGKILVLTRS